MKFKKKIAFNGRIFEILFNYKNTGVSYYLTYAYETLLFNFQRISNTLMSALCPMSVRPSSLLLPMGLADLARLWLDRQLMTLGPQRRKEFFWDRSQPLGAGLKSFFPCISWGVKSGRGQKGAWSIRNGVKSRRHQKCVALVCCVSQSRWSVAYFLSI